MYKVNADYAEKAAYECPIQPITSQSRPVELTARLASKQGQWFSIGDPDKREPGPHKTTRSAST